MTNRFDDLDLPALQARTGAKWSRYGPDVLPLWVADMDLPLPAPVRAALDRVLDGGDLGYPDWIGGNPLADVFAGRMQARFGWAVDADRVVTLTDVVQGIEVAVHLATEPGDAVLVQTPVYPPFLGAVTNQGRRLVESPLVQTASGWIVDPDHLRSVVAAERPPLMLLCHPHNPTGRLFDADELGLIADVAAEFDMVVVSDEIHADLVYGDAKFLPFASVSDNAAARTVTMTSATKAFNLASIRTAVAHLGSDRVREAWQQLPSHLLGSVSLLGVEATLAAWTAGDEWLADVLAQLDANRHRLGELLDEHLPAVGYHVPEATYLAWLDCRSLGLGDDPAAFFLEQAKVALNEGPRFGAPGNGFARLNFACSTAVLDEAVRRMARAAHGG
jgi:cystathionine beta-lyase